MVGQLKQGSQAVLGRWEEAETPFCTSGQNRTGDLLITSQLLYRLSYAGVERRDAFYRRSRGLSSADRKHGLPIAGRRLSLPPETSDRQGSQKGELVPV